MKLNLFLLLSINSLLIFSASKLTATENLKLLEGATETELLKRVTEEREIRLKKKAEAKEKKLAEIKMSGEKTKKKEIELEKTINGMGSDFEQDTLKNKMASEANERALESQIEAKNLQKEKIYKEELSKINKKSNSFNDSASSVYSESLSKINEENAAINTAQRIEAENKLRIETENKAATKKTKTWAGIGTDFQQNAEKNKMALETNERILEAQIKKDNAKKYKETYAEEASKSSKLNDSAFSTYQDDITKENTIKRIEAENKARVEEKSKKRIEQENKVRIEEENRAKRAIHEKVLNDEYFLENKEKNLSKEYFEREKIYINSEGKKVYPDITKNDFKKKLNKIETEFYPNSEKYLSNPQREFYPTEKKYKLALKEHNLTYKNSVLKDKLDYPDEDLRKPKNPAITRREEIKAEIKANQEKIDSISKEISQIDEKVKEKALKELSEKENVRIKNIKDEKGNLNNTLDKFYENQEAKNKKIKAGISDDWIKKRELENKLLENQIEENIAKAEKEKANKPQKEQNKKNVFEKTEIKIEADPQVKKIINKASRRVLSGANNAFLAAVALDALVSKDPVQYIADDANHLKKSIIHIVAGTRDGETKFTDELKHIPNEDIGDPFLDNKYTSSDAKDAVKNGAEDFAEGLLDLAKRTPQNLKTVLGKIGSRAHENSRFGNIHKNKNLIEDQAEINREISTTKNKFIEDKALSSTFKSVNNSKEEPNEISEFSEKIMKKRKKTLNNSEFIKNENEEREEKTIEQKEMGQEKSSKEEAQKENSLKEDQQVFQEKARNSPQIRENRFLDRAIDAIKNNKKAKWYIAGAIITGGAIYKIKKAFQENVKKSRKNSNFKKIAPK